MELNNLQPSYKLAKFSLDRARARQRADDKEFGPLGPKVTENETELTLSIFSGPTKTVKMNRVRSHHRKIRSRDVCSKRQFAEIGATFGRMTNDR